VYLEGVSMASDRDIRDWDAATVAVRGLVLGWVVWVLWVGPEPLRSSATEDKAYWDERLPVSSPRGRDPGEKV
jgi:hypothetical protein